MLALCFAHMHGYVQNNAKPSISPGGRDTMLNIALSPVVEEQY
jgi:hypothetical protein